MTDKRHDSPELFADLPDTEETLLDDADPQQDEFSPQLEKGETDVHFTEDCLSAGSFLRRKRLELGLDVEAVEKETKMKPAHILAIENGNLDELPQPVYPVYVVACVKKLGTLYKIDEKTLSQITAGLKEQILCQVPDDLSKSCYGHEVNEESVRKQKRLLFILFALAGTVILLIAAGIIFLVMLFLRPPDPALKTPFDQKMLLDIQPKVKLNITPLPMVED